MWTPTGVVGQAVQTVPTGTIENCAAVQFVHTTSAVVVQPAALRLVPAAQVEHGVQAVALAADQLMPATQDVHTAFVVAVQVEDRKRPAVQTLEAQGAHGA
jgi:hypothetical protein